MAFLTPANTYTTQNGVVIKEKMIPGAQRPGKLLNTPNHIPTTITIHNTDDINEAAGTNDAEQYARATFNGNMRDVMVHYYIDETDCWHILPNNEIGYHAGDYSNKNGGNWTSLSVEIVEYDLTKVAEKDKAKAAADNKAAEDRGARLAAYLLYAYGLGIEALVTHQHWNGKYCPAYILPHWDGFKALVGKYLDELKKPAPAPSTGKHYRVQVGYYGVYENAVAMRDKLKAEGFDAIIKEE